jgi:hypothetical protein
MQAAITIQKEATLLRIFDNSIYEEGERESLVLRLTVQRNFEAESILESEENVDEWVLKMPVDGHYTFRLYALQDETAPLKNAVVLSSFLLKDRLQARLADRFQQLAIGGTCRGGCKDKEAVLLEAIIEQLDYSFASGNLKLLNQLFKLIDKK